jgi:formylglycine-generating enzyme required for sulfatase activity
MRNVGCCLAVVMIAGCGPSGTGVMPAVPDVTVGDLGPSPVDVVADAGAGPDVTDVVATPLDVASVPDAPSALDVAPASADALDASLALDAAPADVAPDLATTGDHPLVDAPPPPLDARPDDVVAPTADAPVDEVIAVDVACAAGQSRCEGGCVDLRASSSHCGTCGRRCGGGEVCVASACTALPQRSCAGTDRTGCGMVVLDGGRFTLGTPTQCFANPDATCGQSAAPPQTDVAVGRFAIDVYEVTVARFNAYWIVRAQEMGAVRSAPIRYRGGEIAWEPAPNVEPTRQGRDYNWLPATSPRDAHPVNGVDYWLAQEFCVWDGGRLPTEAEWEYVARGAARDGLAAGRVYPWGDDAPSTDCDRARWSYTTCPPGEDGARTMRVGRYPTGAAGGVFDLAGNVWEWVADNFTGYAGTAPRGACDNRSGTVDPLCLTGVARDSRVIRGGAWGDLQAANLRGASRGSYNPTLRGYNIGFRCARDLP